MIEKKDIERLAKDIRSQLSKLENTFWDVFVSPSYPESDRSANWKNERDDNKTWLYHATKDLYYKICVFLELKGMHSYLSMFRERFHPAIYDEGKTLKDRGPLYSESEPSMVIHDEFREFLSPFPEFDFERSNKAEINKLKLILENTNGIILKTKTVVTTEKSIYDPVRWLIEIVYPQTRTAGKGRFIKKFTRYQPDILIPELSSSVEYKIIRKGDNPGIFLDQLKTDADCYTGDPDFKFFYAVVFFESKDELNPEAFKHAVIEKKFPDNWTVLAL